jgi:5-methylcytosine-specific restriction endonuclease McrA
MEQSLITQSEEFRNENRVTHKSRNGKHSITDKDREELYGRDNFTFQYCLTNFKRSNN